MTDGELRAVKLAMFGILVFITWPLWIEIVAGFHSFNDYGAWATGAGPLTLTVLFALFAWRPWHHGDS